MAVLTQTQGCEPVIINPKMFFELKSIYGKSAGVLVTGGQPPPVRRSRDLADLKGDPGGTHPLGRPVQPDHGVHPGPQPGICRAFARRPRLDRMVDADEPPLRLVLGSTSLPIIRKIYADRLDTWENWETVSNAAQGSREARHVEVKE
jgi:hypothetical protein